MTRTAQTVLRNLSEVVRAHQDELRARRSNARDLEFEQVLSRVRRHRQRRARQLGSLALAVGLLLSAAWVNDRLAPASDGAAAEATHWAYIAPAGEVTPVTFDDGSQLQLGPETRARLGNEPRLAAHLMIEAGEVSGQLRPSASGPWRIDAGPFTLIAQAAEFALAWDAGRGALKVQVKGGQLQVRDAAGGEPQLLEAGAIFEASY